MLEKQVKVWFSRSLVCWHTAVNNRTMPWKGIKDPYKIWLSEIILQQTRVEQGLAYYERFTHRFPKIQDLAQASDTEVFKLWEGLGYYNRCRNLLATARRVSSIFDGVFPNTQEGLLALKGIGAYTAAAIGSFAFNLPLAVVDGNVMRVLSRFFAIADPIDGTVGKSRLADLADQLLDRKDPATYNQAIMDLGATVCKPRQPQCTTCPLARKCQAFALGTQDRFPVKAKKTAARERFFYYLILQAGQQTAIKQRQGKDIWSGLHEFMLKETDEPVAANELASLSFWGINTLVSKGGTWELSETITHQLTHQKIHCRFLRAPINKTIPLDEYQWVSAPLLKTLAFPRLITRFMDGDWPEIHA